MPRKRKPPVEPAIPPGVYWVNLEGWRLGRLSYRKRGRVAYVETLGGAETADPEKLVVKPVDAATAAEVERRLDT